MILLSASNLTKVYGITPVLRAVSFHVSQGDRIGIVGSNGAGKSTLLSVLSGELAADEGDFFVSPLTTMGYLKQKNSFPSQGTVYEEMLSLFSDVIELEGVLAELSARISTLSENGQPVEKLLHEYDDLSEVFKEKNGYGYQSEIKGILNSMGFPEGFFDKKVSLLSGGERTRLALSALLLKKPELLLLDEPTNHLDIGTLKWLEQYLKSYTGTIVLISHDRYFLNQTVNRIFEIEHHKLTCYEGNYTAYVEKKRFFLEDAQKRFDAQQREIKRQEEIVRRFRQHGTEKLAKRAGSREKLLDKMERIERPEAKTGKMRVAFKEKFQSGNDVIFAKELSKSFGVGDGCRRLFTHVNLDIKKGDRICIVGANGIGKTTLLKIIMGQLTPDNGVLRLGHNVTIGYYDQEQQLLTEANTVLEELHSTYRLYDETELRSLLGRFLFQGDAVFKQVAALSGGEKARLALLKLMMSGANLLIMDEPTNHLDIESKEIFEDALLEFPGTLLLVSHDRYFLNKVPSNIYELSENGVECYAGGYDYYLEKKEALPSGKSYLDDMAKQTGEFGAAGKKEQAQSEKERRGEERRRSKEEQAQKKRMEKRLTALEDDIARLEDLIGSLEEELCREDVFSDFEKSGELCGKRERAEKDLEKTYEAWVSLNEELQSSNREEEKTE